MNRVAPETQRDYLGYLWPVAKLDALLADPAVSHNAMSIMAIGLLPSGAFMPDIAFGIAKLRYRRPEPAALLTALAVRLWCLRSGGGSNASL